jgi:uncharacterized lipoprotein YajG
MMQRCYSEKFKEKHPTYRGCSVVPEWHTFMNFHDWMVDQFWEGKQLDKDILFEGNKIYGQDTCVFISVETNVFVIDRKNGRGEYPLGVSVDIQKIDCVNKYKAVINVNGKTKHLGVFSTPEEAHKTWLTEKNLLANILADKQSDHRVAEALRIRYKSQRNY